MNNTTITKGNLSLVAILMAATLVIGTFATMATTIGTTQSSKAFAYSQQKKKGDDNNSRNGNTITALKCQNKGSASGFDTALDQECENLICTHPGNNATCVQEGAVATTSTSTSTPVTPVKLTCEQCITKFLSAEQISIINKGRNDLPFLCEQQLARDFTIEEFQGSLQNIEASTAPIDIPGLIQCLIDAGVQFRSDV